MARRVRDLALLLQPIARYDPADPGSVDQPAEDWAAALDGGVRGWRIGVLNDSYFGSLDPAMQAALDAAVVVFAGLGAQIEELAVPELHGARRINSLILTSDAAAYHHERLANDRARFSPDALDVIAHGETFTAAQYAAARRKQLVVRRAVEAHFARFDLLISATTPMAAPLRADADREISVRSRLLRLTAPFNLTGSPALSLPCGRSPEGLPLGMQLIGPHWGEARLLRAGHAYEQATAWHRAEPPC